MNTTNIDGLPVAIILTGSEYLPVVQGGTTKRAQVGLITGFSSGTTTQSANTLYAGPTSGSAAVPTFRALVAADLPAIITLSNGTSSTPTLTGATTTTGLFFGTHFVGLTASGTRTFQSSDTSSIAVPTSRIGSTSNAVLASAGSVTATVLGTGASGTFLSFYPFGTTGSGDIAAIYAQCARGTSTAPTATQSGDTLMQWGANGYDGTTYGGGSEVVDADVTIIAAENMTTSAHGAYIRIRTTPTTTVALAEAARFSASGGLSIGSTTDAGVGGLLLNGTLRINQAPSAMGVSAKTFTSAADSSTNVGHYFTINLNGTTYYVPCSSVAPNG